MSTTRRPAISIVQTNLRLSDRHSQIQQLAKELNIAILDHIPRNMTEKYQKAVTTTITERFYPNQHFEDCSSEDRSKYVQLVRDQFVLKNRLYSPRDEAELTEGVDPEVLINGYQALLDCGCDGISSNIKGLVAALNKIE